MARKKKRKRQRRLRIAAGEMHRAGIAAGGVAVGVLESDGQVAGDPGAVMTPNV
jgi:hypothetical protein